MADFDEDWLADKDDQYDDGEREEGFQVWQLKDSIIFLIDASPSMWEQNDVGEIPFINALRTASNAISDKLISSASDLVSICFYNTRATQNPNDIKQVYLFSPLDEMDVQPLMKIEALVAANNFDAEFGSEENTPIDDALLACYQIFSNCTTKVGNKRIFLFTNNDDPHSSNPELKERAIKKSTDLHELNIEIELFSMNKKGSQFDPTKFYQHIVFAEDGEIANLDVASRLDDLIAQVKKKEFKKRSLGKFTLSIGTQFEIGVSLYNMVQQTKRGDYHQLDAATNQLVKATTKKFCSGTGDEILTEEQTKKAFQYAGQNLYFEKEEMKEIKAFEKPGVRIIGFKPTSYLKPYHNLKHASFIYPSDSMIVGSITAFAALLDRMLAKDKIGIASVTTRSNLPPRLCAIYPSKENTDEDGDQIRPPGLYIIPLPYVEDLRDIDYKPSNSRATDEQTDLAKTVIKSLKMAKFDNREIPNPVLQRHYANLHALALNKETLSESAITDFLLPDTEGMEKPTKVKAVTDFLESIVPDNYVPPDPRKTPKGPTKKRPRSHGGDDDEEIATPSKRRKLDASSADAVDWKAKVADGSISKVQVDMLKQYCRNNSIPNFSKLNKNGLVEAVSNHVKENP